MSYTPPDPFQHNTSSSSNIPSHHTRQSSLPTVYEVTTDNDPYRIHKKSPRLGMSSLPAFLYIHIATNFFFFY